MIHTVHRTDGLWPNGPTNFLNRVCSRAGPGNDQVNGPEAQRFYVTTGTPPKATLRDHPPITGRLHHKYMGFHHPRSGLRCPDLCCEEV